MRLDTTIASLDPNLHIHPRVPLPAAQALCPGAATHSLPRRGHAAGSLPPRARRQYPHARFKRHASAAADRQKAVSRTSRWKDGELLFTHRMRERPTRANRIRRTRNLPSVGKVEVADVSGPGPCLR
jgi:hypothetical protein